jgi:hypothetical protein
MTLRMMSMSNKHIRLIHYIRHTLRDSQDIDNTLLELVNKFSFCQDKIIDLYILIKEQKNGTHKKQMKQYKYDSFNSTRKSQKDLVNKIKDNIR